MLGTPTQIYLGYRYTLDHTAGVPVFDWYWSRYPIEQIGKFDTFFYTSSPDFGKFGGPTNK